MSPVARRPGGAHTGRAVVISALVVVLALGMAFGVASLASRGDVEVRLGDDRFEAGDAENLAGIIDEGGPVLFPDVARFTRAVYVDHTGEDPTVGWIAVGAFVPDDPECTLTFDPDRARYVSSCDESVAFLRSGDGLRRYETEVVDGDLFVDLQDPEDR